MTRFLGLVNCLASDAHQEMKNQYKNFIMMKIVVKAVVAGYRGGMDRIGQDIRALRKARRMTIVDFADTIGRSVGWLSQVERGMTVPSVHDLGQIAQMFDLNIGFFFRSAGRSPQEQGRIVRAADRSAIGSAATGLREELLSPDLTGSFEMIRSVFAPQTKSEGIRPAREKEDGGIVVSGRLTLRIGDTWHELSPGDSFQFSGESYAWENPGDEPAEVIWVVSPPIY